MIQVIPKWKVTVKFTDRVIEVWISDHHLGNVLRQLSMMEFSGNALEEPIEIAVMAPAR